MLINDFLILVAKVQHYLHKKCRNYHFFGTNRLLSETIATKRMNKQVGSALWGNEHAKVVFFLIWAKSASFWEACTFWFVVCYFMTSLTRRTAMPYKRDVSACGLTLPFWNQNSPPEIEEYWVSPPRLCDGQVPFQ